MPYYKYFINIASVFIPLEANILPTRELVCLFSFILGWLVFVEVEITFKRVIGSFAMFLYDAVFIRFGVTFWTI